METQTDFEKGIAHINGSITDDGVRYYDHGMREYYLVETSDAELLGRRLAEAEESDEPGAVGQVYSIWCADTDSELEGE